MFTASKHGLKKTNSLGGRRTSDPKFLSSLPVFAHDSKAEQGLLVYYLNIPSLQEERRERWIFRSVRLLGDLTGMNGGEERQRRLDNVLFHERSDKCNNIMQKETGLLSTDPFKAFDKVSFVRRKESISFPTED